METVTNFEKDQLSEVVNIGAGNASVALSQMIGENVLITVPEIFVDTVEQAIARLGDPERVRTVILLKVLGDAPGTMLLIFSPESALNLAALLTKTQKKNRLDELDRSALREVGNILSGAAMAALSRFLGMYIVQSVPDAATDMLGAVVDSVLAEIGLGSDTVLIFKVRFTVEGKDVEAQLFFLFDPHSTKKILEKTKKKLSA